MEAAERQADAEGPRERLLRLGASSLSDSELLAVLLGTGFRGHPVLSLAEGLVATAGGLRALVQRDPHELSAHPGLGPAKAAAVLAALELGRRAQRAAETRPRLRSPEEIFQYVRPWLGGLRNEEFHALCFNARNVLVRDARIAQGTPHLCLVDPREVFGAAIATRASALVLVHNHPSGDPEPSAEDVQLTRQLCAGARILGVRLLDHIVVGDEGYCSMRARGLVAVDGGASAHVHLSGTAR
ncbi:MAG: RadC family protein [Myxococcota bacterium]